VPDRPEAWLLTAARRALGHAARPALEWLAEVEPERADIPDRRPQRLLVCAHPAIAPEAQAPLMPQTVLGLDAGRIAAAFLTSPAAMGQRAAGLTEDAAVRAVLLAQGGP
jgi:RNA polymerase sigma-70 factor (ECF subfamily)